MYRLAACEFRDRRVLVVEADQQTATIISASVLEAGGTVTGFAATVQEAVELVARIPADIVVLDVRYVALPGPEIQEVFRSRNLQVEWLAFDDPWFDPEDDFDGDIAVSSGKCYGLGYQVMRRSTPKRPGRPRS